MRTQIDATDDTERERVLRFLQYSLTGYNAEIGSLHLTVSPVHETLGTNLSRCQLRATVRHGQPIEIVEIQSTLDLAVTRALKRCTRTIRRRLAAPLQGRIS